MVEAMVSIWASMFLTISAIVIFALDRFAMELVGLGIIIAALVIATLLTEAGYQAPSSDMLLEGFASPALITILALLVIGQSLFRTGALSFLFEKLLKPSPKWNRQNLILIALLIATVTSAFMNNTPITIIFIPIISALMQGYLPLSKYMMSLSFLTVLGGMTTLVGSSTNLLVASTSESLGGPAIGFFDFFAMGSILALVGSVYCLFILPRLLPNRSEDNQFSRQQGKQYVVQLSLHEGHPFVGARAVSGLFPELNRITIKLVTRNHQKFFPPYDDITLMPGDEVVATSTRERLTEVLARTPTPEEDDRDIVLTEVVVAPGSRLEGRALSATGFSERTKCSVLGLQRRAKMIHTNLDAMYVQPGDVLLLSGSSESIQDLQQETDVLVLANSMGEIPPRKKAPLAMCIFLATILTSALAGIPILITSCLGAFAMLASGCIQLSQALRAIDARIIFIVASSYALGQMLQHTGAAEMLTEQFVQSAVHLSSLHLASAMFLCIALLTNLLSNNATAIIFTPIALGLATSTGGSAELFLHATIFAANCCFATPMAYQTNLLVMTPGQYRFQDFMRGGLPLIIILWITFSIMATFLYR